jgi:hypothetical protein
LTVAARARWPIFAALLVAAAVSAAVPPAGPGAQVVVRDEGGDILARVDLADDGRLTLRYRNSVYASLAEERFVAQGSALRLVELAADERAILDEYYETVDSQAAGPGDERDWRAAPRRDLVVERLAVAATDLGRRTLLVPGQPPLELWRLVDDTDPTVVIALEPPG